MGTSIKMRSFTLHFSWLIVRSLKAIQAMSANGLYAQRKCIYWKSEWQIFWQESQQQRQQQCDCSWMSLHNQRQHRARCAAAYVRTLYQKPKPTALTHIISDVMQIFVQCFSSRTYHAIRFNSRLTKYWFLSLKLETLTKIRAPTTTGQLEEWCSQ